MRFTRFLIQVEVTAQRGILAVSRGIGHLAHADTPFAERRLVNDERERKMPRITPRACEVGRHIRGEPSLGRPTHPAHKAGTPRETRESQSVHGLFRSTIAFALALMLWCTLTLAAGLLQSQVEVTAQRGILAVSRGIGHLAHADTPFAERRLLVNRQPG